MKTKTTYIPALNRKGWTPLYDPFLRWGMQEEKFKRELIRQAKIQPGQSVLDLGCGTATLTIMLKQTHPDVVVTGLDADPEVLQIGRTKAEKAGVQLSLHEGMADDLPYPDGSFDLVVSSLMFHHLTTQAKQQTMKEVYRVLRRGGYFWIADLGPPRSVWSRIISPIMARLEEASDNNKGLLLPMLSLAGFNEVTSPVHFATMVGMVYLYSGQKTGMK